MSSRSDVADKIAETLVELGLNDSYGVNVGKADNNKCYHVTFCKARVLDGAVKFYGPKFVLVSWMTAFRDMPHKGTEKFSSVDAAVKFIKESFVR